MTFSPNETSNSSQSNQSFNLQQKGLGWLPDLPDQRDYTLNSEEVQFEKRLKRSKDTEWIEDIGDKLIRISETINHILEVSDVNEKFKEHQDLLNILKTFPNNLKAKIFGDINFENIKLYKVFRKGLPSHADVIKLKIYLSSLGYRNFFKIKSTTPFHSYLGKGQQYKTHAEWYIRWITSEEFLDDTEEIVMSFQKTVGLPELGIVSMATYSALEESLKYPSCKPDSFIQQLKNEKLDHITLIPIPVSLPRPFLAIFFKELKEIAVKQIRKETGQHDELFEKIFLDKNIKNLQPAERDIFERLFSAQEGDSIEKTIEKLEQNLSKNHLDVSTDEGYEQLLKVVQSEHFVIEPIIAFILKVTFPLALHQRDLQTYISETITLLTKINQILICKAKDPRNSFEELRKSIEKDYSDVELEDLYQFAIRSLKTFKSLFSRAGLKAVIEELREEDESRRERFNSTLCFYFLLSKLVKTLTLGLEESTDAKQVPELNKTEFFRPVQPQKTDDKKLELFSHPDLAIPISNNFYTSINYALVKESKTIIPFFYLPVSVDLSYWCSAIEDQGKLNACSAFAGVALLEYFANRSDGKYTDVSPLFLYKAARNLMQTSGDIGASLRETLKAMEKFGVPPIQYWPYLPSNVDEEPPQFCYSFAKNYQALKYFRLDYAGISEETLLFQVKAVLAAGFPCAFGFTLYASADDDENVRKGWISFPTRNDRRVGGHAVVAVGYSDFETVGQKTDDNQPGAFLIRNSWGKTWGRGGYGWLPYSYVLQGLTADWWSLLKATWFEQDSFGLGASEPGGIWPFTTGRPR